MVISISLLAFIKSSLTNVNKRLKVANDGFPLSHTVTTNVQRAIILSSVSDEVSKHKMRALKPAHINEIHLL